MANDATVMGAAGTGERIYTCPWCGTVSDGTRLSCPGCGSSVDVRTNVTESGWLEAPGQKDMAKLQFGKSFCQIEGKYVPVADMNLAAEDAVYFAHHALLWTDPQVTIKAMSLKGAWKRLMAGMPLIMTEARGPGHIAFSRDLPGELLALRLQPGRAVDVREHIFLVATSQVQYDWFPTNIWFVTGSGDDKETHYPLGGMMDRFQVTGKPGLLLLHAGGNVFYRDLAPGQVILVKPTALLFKDLAVTMQLHFEEVASGFSFFSSWLHRYLWLRLTGPGRVAIQSAFEPVEDDGKTITNYSSATRRRWS